jgi:hypothetical protein
MKSSVAFLLLPAALLAQGTRHQLNVSIPEGAPISVVSSEWGESRAAARGAALVIDLKTSLRFRNNSKLRLRGVSLEVRTQDMAAGGKASVSVPSLDVYPGQEFPVRVDLRLLQPGAAGTDSGKAAVRVQLDGVLFEDLSFFGPNSLQSRRTLTAWEMEARRDRQRLRMILAKGGEDGLRQEILERLAKSDRQPHWDVKVARGPAALPSGESVQLAFSKQADWPVEGIPAKAIRNGNEIRLPEITVSSKTDRHVRFVEYTLMARDKSGRMMAAGTLPSPVALRPQERAALRSNVAIELRQAEGQQPVAVESLTGVLSQVEFSNGEVWIPSRAGLDQLGLGETMPVSLEMQRLSGIYQRKGAQALIEELKKFD